MIAGNLTKNTPLRSAFSRGLATADGYLHKSRIPMHHFQPSLPRLPLPKLDSTLKKYLYFVQPLLTEAQFLHTSKAVAEFEKGVGKELHEQLFNDNAKNTHTSYISKPWFDMYLENREPLAININPQLTWRDDTSPAKMNQLDRSVSLIASAVRFHRTYRDGYLEPDVFHMNPKKSKESALYNGLLPWVPSAISFYAAAAFEAYALDMSQYAHLFSSTRLPFHGKDQLKAFKNSKHIVVQRGAQFFQVEVLNDNGTAKSDAEIHDAMSAILSQPVKVAGTDDSVGVLTSQERNEWASARAELEKSNVNAASLHAIDSAIFSVVLEDQMPSSELEGVSAFLHGNGRNRWFDKSFQMIVLPNGTSALNFEHSWGDGVAVLRFFEEVYKDSLTNGPINPPAGTKGGMKELKFEIGSSTKDAIKRAVARLDGNIADLKLHVLQSDLINRSFPKTHKISPDGVMQMSLQLAYRKLTGGVGSTYESANTSAFKHGRTETIRSATKEAAEFSRLFMDKNASLADKEAALRTAVNNHSKITKDAVLGQGVDRHLFVLRRLAGSNLPSIYTDEGYQIYNKIILSTSTLSSPALLAGGFGPVNRDCYGVGYEITANQARFSVSTYKDNGGDFCGAIEESLRDIKAVLEK